MISDTHSITNLHHVNHDTGSLLSWRNATCLNLATWSFHPHQSISSSVTASMFGSRCRSRIPDPLHSHFYFPFIPQD